MPYKMNPQQFEAVLKLSSQERNAHFVSKVADWQQLWGIKSEEGWLVPLIESENLKYLPVWPHPEYAQRIADIHFPDHMATEISLDEFLNDWLPDMKKDGAKIGVFPDKDWSIWVMEPDDLAELLYEELSLYE